jgi:hypothetical protein
VSLGGDTTAILLYGAGSAVMGSFLLMLLDPHPIS